VNAADRARMRDTLRAAVGKALLPGAELTHPGPFLPAATHVDLVERFRKELTALGGTVHEASSADEIVSILRSVADALPNGKLLTWDQAELPVAGLIATLGAAGFEIVSQSPDLARSGEHRHTLASCAIGLSGSDAALAETGSIVIASGPGRGRLASLLPKTHVALIRRSTIVWSLPVLIASQPELVTRGANFVCITGPSRTADIEHVLARGVHGPGDVHAILVD
jgi:L-lactate dehydrogenase complex protein LldG